VTTGILTADNHRTNLERYRRAYESGDSGALLDAVHYCLAIAHIEAPTWVVQGWAIGFSTWRGYEADTLDSAFNVKRTHLKARRKNVLAGMVWQYINGRRKVPAGKRPALDDQLFEDAAKHVNQRMPKELHINRTKAKELFRAIKT
jgi:hypothetical protein